MVQSNSKAKTSSRTHPDTDTKLDRFIRTMIDEEELEALPKSLYEFLGRYFSTDLQKEIVIMYMAGYRPEEIANTLACSKWYVYKVIEKLKKLSELRRKEWRISVVTIEDTKILFEEMHRLLTYLYNKLLTYRVDPELVKVAQRLDKLREMILRRLKVLEKIARSGGWLG